MSQQTPDSADSVEPEGPPPGSHPGAGCIIIMLAFGLLGGIVAYGIYSGIRQDRDIATFTHETPQELPSPEGDSPRFAEIDQRLADFAAAGTSGKPQSFSLTAEELNILIAQKPALADVRGTVWFTGVENDRLGGRIALPINRLAFWKPPRYLNGTCTFKVESAEGRIFLRIDTLEIDTENEVPEGFTERMQQSDLLAPYKSNEDLEKLFESHLAARFEGDRIVAETRPSDAPPEK